MPLIDNLFRLLHIPDIVRRVEKEDAIALCAKSCLAGGCVFYPSARVLNFSNDRSRIRLGNNTHVRGELLVFPYGGEVVIGDDCYIGEGTRIWSGARITIGSNVLIGHNVNVIDFSHELGHLERAEGFKNQIKNGHPREIGNIPVSSITVGNYVAIYPGSSILRGITIGEGAQISTGSVVMKDVEPFTVMAGNPAKTMWRLTPESMNVNRKDP